MNTPSGLEMFRPHRDSPSAHPDQRHRHLSPLTVSPSTQTALFFKEHSAEHLVRELSPEHPDFIHEAALQPSQSNRHDKEVLSLLKDRRPRETSPYERMRRSSPKFPTNQPQSASHSPTAKTAEDRFPTRHSPISPSTPRQHSRAPSPMEAMIRENGVDQRLHDHLRANGMDEQFDDHSRLHHLATLALLNMPRKHVRSEEGGRVFNGEADEDGRIFNDDADDDGRVFHESKDIRDKEADRRDRMNVSNAIEYRESESRNDNYGERTFCNGKNDGKMEEEEELATTSDEEPEVGVEEFPPAVESVEFPPFPFSRPTREEGGEEDDDDYVIDARKPEVLVNERRRLSEAFGNERRHERDSLFDVSRQVRDAVRDGRHIDGDAIGQVRRHERDIIIDGRRVDRDIIFGTKSQDRNRLNEGRNETAEREDNSRKNVRRSSSSPISPPSHHSPPLPHSPSLPPPPPRTHLNQDSHPQHPDQHSKPPHLSFPNLLSSLSSLHQLSKPVISPSISSSSSASPFASLLSSKFSPFLPSSATLESLSPFLNQIHQSRLVSQLVASHHHHHRLPLNPLTLANNTGKSCGRTSQ